MSHLRRIPRIRVALPEACLYVCNCSPDFGFKKLSDDATNSSTLTMTEAADFSKVSILGKESIHCGFHLVPHVVQTVVTTLPSSTYVLVTDTVVASYHLKKFQDEFRRGLDGKNARFLHLVVAPGETSKSREGKAQIEDFLLEQKCTRDTVILALGGGVIGDLVGFVAATL